MKRKNAFSRKLHRFLFSKRQMLLLPGYGWNDGGCWALAEALIRWSNGALELHGVWHQYKKGRRVITHLVAQSKSNTDIYLDGDGILTSRELLEWKMELMEGVSECYLSPVTPDQVRQQGEIPAHAKVAELLAQRLSKRFGEFNQLNLN